MTGIDAYVNIIIGLLGVAYPVLLQVVARLDEKYSSDKIVELFNQEWENKAFRYTLFSSLFFLVVWTLNRPPLIQINGLNFLIENSASTLLAFNSILLVIFFFYFVERILIYYTPSKFIPHLIKRYEKSENDIQYFVALTELLLIFINKQQTKYSITLSDFFNSAFEKIRSEQLNRPVVYPIIYYEVVYKAIEELAILKEKRNYLLEHRTSGEIWLLGEFQDHEISENTYSWMWRNILLAIRYEQDDLILNHWETCHQFYVRSLPNIQTKYDNSSENFKVTNQAEINKRLAERQRFIEFHYALGGLLLYEQRYNCIRRIFNYTQNEPPKYVLLPGSMQEIFKFYSVVRDPYEMKFTWISNLYPFPQLSGLNADTVIKKWIKSYMALLFLRQYTIYSYLSTRMSLDYPPTPNTQREIKEWIDGLDFFKKLVSEHLQNTDLRKNLSLDFITLQWGEDNHKPFPITFIETLKLNLERNYSTNALNLPISDDKVLHFNKSSSLIIESSFDDLMLVNNKSDFQDENPDKWYVNGERSLHSKDAFSDNPESHYTNYDSFLASNISRRLKEGLSETFLYKRTKSFLLKSADIFKAIHRLKIDKRYVIVNFGVYLDYHINQLKIPNLSINDYNGINICSIDGSGLVGNSLFIIKKSNLPSISTKPIDAELKAKYSLKKISNKINLFSSVIDLNKTTPEILVEIKKDKSIEELKKSVLLSLIISAEIKWKKEIEIIQLEEYSEYSQNGIVAKLEDVHPIDK